MSRLPEAQGQTLLTDREREVLALRADGRSIDEIAALLFVESRTVRFHLRKLYAKLGISAQSQVARQRALAAHAQHLGLIPSHLPEELARQLDAIREQSDALARQGAALFNATVRTLCTTLEQRSPPTFGHSRRVALTAEILAVPLRLSATEAEKLHIAGLLHDIGKVGIREAVLTKVGRLSDDEFAHMRLHVSLSRQILEQLAYPPGYEDLPVIVGQHHERPNGTGFPDALSGDAITLGARILCVADVYDALRMHRPYKPAMGPEQALAFLKDATNDGALDPSVVAAFESRHAEIERATAPTRAA